jgi:CRISPR type III-B/RAMP module-associated protein Cmr5
MPNATDSKTPSLEQKRAALAWKFVSPLEAANQAKLRKGYYSLIRGFPSMVQSMGIGQALAFLMSRAQDEEAHRTLRDHLTEWLFHADSPVPWTQKADRYDKPENKLMSRLLDESDPEIWWFAEEEAIAFSLWLKRFTEAITPPKERQGD